MKTLKEIQNEFKFNTDKNTSHTYLDVYDDLFRSFQNKNIYFLEIGILHGESLKLWSKYFINGIIVGIDTFGRISYKDVKKNLNGFDNIHIHQVDSCDSEDISITSRNMFNNLYKNVKFDIIIDDGNHSSLNQIKTFNNFKNLLNVGGIYVIEDIKNRDGHLDNIKNNLPELEIINMSAVSNWDNILGVYKNE